MCDFMKKVGDELQKRLMEKVQVVRKSALTCLIKLAGIISVSV